MMMIEPIPGPIDLGDLSMDGIISAAIHDKLGWMMTSAGFYRTSEAKLEAIGRMRDVVIEWEPVIGPLPRCHAMLNRMAQP